MNTISRTFGILLCAGMLCFTATIAAEEIPFSGGAGSADDPYLIANTADLLALANTTYEPFLAAHYRMTADIDATPSRNWNDGAGMKPVGDYNILFNGVFDGDGHVIDNLYINRPTEKTAGVFAHIAAAAGIYRLGVTGHITGGLAAGGIAGVSEGIIANCFALCAVSGSIYHEYSGIIPGGLVGNIAGLSDGTIRECFSGGTARGLAAGGVCGAAVGDWTDITSSSWITVHDSESAPLSGGGGVLGAAIPCTILAVLVETVPEFNCAFSMLSTFSTGMYSSEASKCRYGSIGACGWGQFDSDPPLFDVSLTNAAAISQLDYARTTSQLTAASTFDEWDFTTPVWTMTEGRTYPHLARTGPQGPQLLTLSVSSGGTVRVLAFDHGGYIPATPPYAFAPGTPLRLEATPDEGQVFAGWAGLPVLTGYNQPAMLLTLVHSATIAAQFVPEVTPTPMPYVRIAEHFRTENGTKSANGSEYLWGVVSPDVTAMRINGVTLALNSLLCAESIYYTYSSISGMQKWTWLSEPLVEGGNVFTIEADIGAQTATDAITVTIEPEVEEDTTPPVIALLGDAEMTLECGAEFQDPGATATDDVDGDLTAAIAVTGAVDISAPGAYALTYAVSDTSGNGAQVVRTVTVTDTSLPVLTLQGDAEITLTCGQAYNEPGATAADACAGDLSGAIVIGGGPVDPAVAGDYTLSYDVSDPAGNAAAQLLRTVHVAAIEAPSIALVGDAEMTLECGGVYTEPGFAASDPCDGDLHGAVTVTGAADTANPGGYTLTYAVENSYGLTAQAQRTVQIADTIPPVLALLGTPEVMIVQGKPYVEPGYTATDTCAGNLVEHVTVTGLGMLTTAIPGDYTLTYHVADPSGNAAAPLERVIHVLTAEGIAEELNDNLDTADTDDDGRLSYEEAVLVIPGMDLIVFGELDTNMDGYLEEDELDGDDGCCGCHCNACDGKKSLDEALGDMFMIMLSAGVLLAFARRMAREE